MYFASGFDGFGEVLQPAGSKPGMAQQTGPVPKRKEEYKLIKGNVDQSLAALAGNLGINGPTSQIKK